MTTLSPLITETATASVVGLSSLLKWQNFSSQLWDIAKFDSAEFSASGYLPLELNLKRVNFSHVPLNADLSLTSVKSANTIPNRTWHPKSAYLTLRKRLNFKDSSSGHAARFSSMTIIQASSTSGQRAMVEMKNYVKSDSQSSI